ncbi:hypothetical protein WJX81_002466 [Elliptochloris bilobata]|uniref:Uncharacterized protein n=1 Tax=Elliptochloris bilobata TaxID=381761 RepID=A0AAW1QCZ0_9CHLO
MGAIFEYEGVVLADTSDLHSKAWLQLAAEEGKARPLQWALQRAQGMKDEQVVQEVFCWSRNPAEVRHLAARKEELYRALLGEHSPPVAPGVKLLLETLTKHQVPAALATSAPEARVRAALHGGGLDDLFMAVVTSEDVSRGRPDPEPYLLAAQQIGRPPVRCVIIGNSNQSVEAAREGGMAAVVVAGQQPLYELGAADLVVRQLDELSLVNLKQLFRNEAHVERGAPEPELQLEQEAEDVFEPLTFDHVW